MLEEKIESINTQITPNLMDALHQITPEFLESSTAQIEEHLDIPNTKGIANLPAEAELAHKVDSRTAEQQVAKLSNILDHVWYVGLDNNDQLTTYDKANHVLQLNIVDLTHLPNAYDLVEEMHKPIKIIQHLASHAKEVEEIERSLQDASKKQENKGQELMNAKGDLIEVQNSKPDQKIVGTSYKNLMNKYTKKLDVATKEVSRLTKANQRAENHVKNLKEGKQRVYNQMHSHIDQIETHSDIGSSLTKGIGTFSPQMYKIRRYIPQQELRTKQTEQVEKKANNLLPSMIFAATMGIIGVAALPYILPSPSSTKSINHQTNNKIGVSSNKIGTQGHKRSIELSDKEKRELTDKLNLQIMAHRTEFDSEFYNARIIPKFCDSRITGKIGKQTDTKLEFGTQEIEILRYTKGFLEYKIKDHKSIYAKKVPSVFALKNGENFDWYATQQSLGRTEIFTFNIESIDIELTKELIDVSHKFLKDPYVFYKGEEMSMDTIINYDPNLLTQTTGTLQFGGTIPGLSGGVEVDQKRDFPINKKILSDIQFIP